MLTLSDRLKELRAEKNLHQADVASAIGVTKSALSSYENGYRAPSYGILLDIADFYNVTTDYLLGRQEIKSVIVENLTAEETNLVLALTSYFISK